VTSRIRELEELEEQMDKTKEDEKQG